MVNKSQYIADLEPPFCSLAVKKSFDGLTREEKLYAHWISKASWAGARVIMEQWAPHANSLYDFLILFFTDPSTGTIFADMEEVRKKAGVEEDEFRYFVGWTAQVLSNLVNYKCFGNTNPKLSEYWPKLKEVIYSLDPEPILQIGKPSSGHLSNLYPDSPSISDAEVEQVSELMRKEGIEPQNTRLRKDGNGQFTLLIASVENGEHEKNPLKGESLEIKVQLGDYKDSMAKVVSFLEEAVKWAKDENQAGMLKDYITSFRTGSMSAHREGSKKWVTDIGPVVESYIGFVEKYLDPYGTRAEWEGFVAVVDKEQSKLFKQMVDEAPELIQALPWGKDFEVDEFKKPDFTSLEILSFATGDIPAGINIPNYPDIRQSLGFKNVSLGNVTGASAPTEPNTFIAPEDDALFNEWKKKSWEMQVACHELLGHGTGKLLTEDKDGTLNFDVENVLNPITKGKVKTWYKSGETWSTFGGEISSSFEECRAEAVALFLANDKRIAKIFGLETEEEVELMQYTTFLGMCRSGLRALQWYDTKTKKHGQAHMQARCGILKWMHSKGIVNLEEKHDADGTLIDVYIRIDRENLKKNGQKVAGDLLLLLGIYKSTADPTAKSFYHNLTTPHEKWQTELRDLVLKKKVPRKIFVQDNTFVQHDEAILKEYELSAKGAIQSFIERGL
ncbi:aflatoxin-detoxifizyme [Atractiella rhizophila]|nr:aflatoxin-detoxifizyme [Atractiella rhizophila]